ncbi:TPA: hypothetical protein ACH3X2_008142 [Trebouxia sp. C0005]|nr:MAG: hypothetical protein FRX49_12857 [Trebouxia sp. A1-2]
MLRASSWQAPGQTVQQQQAEYGPNMPGGADRLPEQTLEQGMGEVGTPKPHQHSPQGQARDGVNAAGSGLTPSKASQASWAGRDCEEGTTKQVPSLKSSDGGPTTAGRGPGKSAEGPIKASRGHWLQDNAADKGQQQGAVDVLPKGHTLS